MTGIEGSWVVHIRFVRGEVAHSMQVEQEGDVLQGRYRSQYGERRLEGRIEGDRIRFRVPMHYQAVGATYGFDGKLDGKILRGRVDLGEYWQGEWEAKRTESGG